jgi:peptide/nickel transport system permease protein
MRTWRSFDTERDGDRMLVDTPGFSEAEDISIAPLPAETRQPAALSQWRMFLRRFLRHRLAVASSVILVVMYVVVSFPHLFAPYPLNPAHLGTQHGPSASHWLGTDELGRDMTTRIMYSAHVSMTIGLSVAVFSTVIGTVVGSLAGYFGGWVDQVLMRITDLFLIVPAIAVVAMIQQGLENRVLPIVGHLASDKLIILALSVLFWQAIARVVRGLFLSIREKEFVDAARASGASSWRVMFRHILPNAIGPIMVNTTLVVAAAILLESALSFLGLGVKSPGVSLGLMLSDAENFVGTKSAYLLYFPGFTLLLIVLCVNFLGDGLRDALDPRSRH